jgi:uncharacterized protein with von Willebrand factor type A (vWA) domain
MFFRRKNNMEEKARFEILLEHMNQTIDLILEAQLSTKIKLLENREEARKQTRKTNLKLDLMVQSLSDKFNQNRETINEIVSARKAP